MILDEVFDEVQELVGHTGARISEEIEPFLRKEIERFSGARNELLAHVRKNASAWFRSARQPPEWIQDADWQVWDERPMLFLGQLDIPKDAGLFHDDASVYVFLSPETGVTETVIQVA